MIGLFCYQGFVQDVLHPIGFINQLAQFNNRAVAGSGAFLWSGSSFCLSSAAPRARKCWRKHGALPT